ncbi:MAG: hypothetical protein M3R65_01590 [Gemmatimonadota bacterium]|nr:hypothetical protein [Gemmatimonadota bacterium]
MAEVSLLMMGQKVAPRLTIGLVGVCMAASRIGAQSSAPAISPAACDTIVSRAAAGQLSGMRVLSVTANPLPPAPLPGRAGRLVSHLHRTTRVATLLRDFSVTAGDTVDTLVIGEAMRRLRQRAYLGAPALTAVRCGGRREVALTLTTVDKWSLNPSFSAQSNSSYGGVEERNLFGTGRAGNLSLATRDGRLGGALGYADPFLLNFPMNLRLRIAEYGDGDEVRARLRNSEQSVNDLWRYSVAVSRYRRDTNKDEAFGGSTVVISQAFHREGAFLLVGRRIGDVSDHANSILFGFDFERAFLNAPDNSPTIGPKLVERRYHGPTVGLARRAAEYDTVSWLSERRIIIDVPHGLETEGLLSLGREDVTRHAAAFGSLWIGRMWVTGSERLGSLDFWTSGYRIGNRNNFDAASTRALFSYYARHGSALYTLHVSGEKLVNPDPDVRALATFDPTRTLVPTVYRLSENAAAAEFERATHVRSPIHAFNIDAALFTAGSYRTASALSQRDHYGVLAIGAGLRLIPGSQGSGALRLDALLPLVRSPAGGHGVTFALSVAPWLQANRQREDPRNR